MRPCFPRALRRLMAAPELPLPDVPDVRHCRRDVADGQEAPAAEGDL